LSLLCLTIFLDMGSELRRYLLALTPQYRVRAFLESITRGQFKFLARNGTYHKYNLDGTGKVAISKEEYDGARSGTLGADYWDNWQPAPVEPTSAMPNNTPQEVTSLAQGLDNVDNAMQAADNARANAVGSVRSPGARRAAARAQASATSQTAATGSTMPGAAVQPATASSPADEPGKPVKPKTDWKKIKPGGTHKVKINGEDANVTYHRSSLASEAEVRKMLKGSEPGDVLDALAAGFEGKIPIKNATVTAHASQLSIKFDNGGSGDEKLSVERQIYLPENGEKYAYHAYYHMPKGQQGEGVGKAFFRDALKEYDRLGITRVKVSAGLDGGKYAWARYGFIPSPERAKIMSKQASDALKNSPEIEKQLTSAQKSMLNHIFKEMKKDPQMVWELADTRYMIKRNVYDSNFGKVVMKEEPVSRFLLNQVDQWDGNIDLTLGSDTRKRLEGYIGYGKDRKKDKGV
jgi:hypothetical protein